jgi:hypothetical protein
MAAASADTAVAIHCVEQTRPSSACRDPDLLVPLRGTTRKNRFTVCVQIF